MNLFHFLFIGSLFLLIAMGPNPSTGGGRETASPPNADTGDNSKAPDFALKDLQGRSHSLSALKGKVVLLNFWATWCPPCKAEMPSMNKLYNDIKTRGFEIIAVSADNSPSAIREFLSKNRLDFPVLFDETKSVTRLYHVFSMPTTFLIDRNGGIVEKFYGEEDWTDPVIRKKIEKLL
ncbi:MAG: TlpA family protein disulfide reductase [Nitrospirae bacterium]|nr:TlpA family protein disulfide reductase [Nitrospirota bacterium]